GQTDVDGQVFGRAPIILYEGPEHLPAAASHRTQERLVVNSPQHLPQQHVRGSIAGEGSEIKNKAILERVGFPVHLLGSNLAEYLDIELATNHVERVGDRENVGS